LGWKSNPRAENFHDYYTAKACLERGLEKNYKEKYISCKWQSKSSKPRDFILL